MSSPKTTESEEQRKAREAVEAIARNISALAKAVQGILGGPLKRRTLLILLANSSGLSQSVVDKVLDAIATLEKDFLK